MAPNAKPRPTRGTVGFSLPFLVLSGFLMFQIGFFQGKQQTQSSMFTNYPISSATTTTDPTTNVTTFVNLIPRPPERVVEFVNANATLSLPIGEAVNLPSVRINQTRGGRKGTIYGGEGDKQHLGGFTDIDFHGISPAAWRHMLETVGIKSLIDVGCGRGISTSWFLFHGVDALCVEGSHDAVEKTMLPSPATQMVEHDFSRGPWWPSKTYDAVWCVEFLEHVGRNFHRNYIPTFRKAALIFASHSNWGGWHHVEVHDDNWWITKMEMYGFQYSPRLTETIRTTARTEKGASQLHEIRPNERYNAQHVWLSMMVFVNPLVASLPQHAHLMAQMGCYDGRLKAPRECGTGSEGEGETPLPDEYKPLQSRPEIQAEWERWVKKHITSPEEDKNK